MRMQRSSRGKPVNATRQRPRTDEHLQFPRACTPWTWDADRNRQPRTAPQPGLAAPYTSMTKGDGLASRPLATRTSRCATANATTRQSSVQPPRSPHALDQAPEIRHFLLRHSVIMKATAGRRRTESPKVPSHPSHPDPVPELLRKALLKWGLAPPNGD